MSVRKLIVPSLAAIAVVAMTGEAFATNSLSSSISTVGTNITSVPVLVNYASYIIGVALGVAGVSKLKQHVDNPGQTPIKDGLGRVAAAALFISLPYLLDIAQNTTGMGSDSNSFQTISTPSGF